MVVEDEGRVEQRAAWPLAGGIDVQLALENVVDDGLGQVIHHVAVPVLQGQPGGEERVIRPHPSQKQSRGRACPLFFRERASPTPHDLPLLGYVTGIPIRKSPLAPVFPSPSWRLDFILVLPLPDQGTLGKLLKPVCSLVFFSVK